MKAKNPKRAIRHAAKKRRPMRAPPVPESEHGDYTYDELLLTRLLDRGSKMLVPESSILFAAALSSMTPALRRLSQSRGYSLGRALYALLARRRRYRWHGDSIKDLVEFFEAVGYRGVKYRIIDDDLEIGIGRREGHPLDGSVHHLERGIISGFLSAATGKRVDVYEPECAAGPGGYCTFSTRAGYSPEPYATPAAVSACATATDAEPRIPVEYQMLCAYPITERAYSRHMAAIMSGIGSMLVAGNPAIAKPSARATYAAKVAAGLGLGAPRFMQNPPRIEVLFDGARAKKEFVEISIGFLGGILGDPSRGRTPKSTYSMRGGSYRAVIGL
jgi:predicted hydrocarbon binding protein